MKHKFAMLGAVCNQKGNYCPNRIAVIWVELESDRLVNGHVIHHSVNIIKK